jgi:hypothetical protein
MAIYIASDEPLPLVDDHKGAMLYTTPLRDEQDQAVRRHFSKPHVVYAGSYEGCGCGFFKLEAADYIDPEDVEACRGSLSALAAYLSDALRQGGAVEVFTCWEGDQARAASHHAVATPRDIAAGILKGDSREFFTIQPAA